MSFVHVPNDYKQNFEWLKSKNAQKIQVRSFANAARINVHDFFSMKWGSFVDD